MHALTPPARRSLDFISLLLVRTRADCTAHHKPNLLIFDIIQTASVFVGVIVGIIFVVQQVQAAVAQTKES